LAGQVGIDRSTGALAEGGVAAQTRHALANVAAVLGDCGAALSDVAKTTVFLVDMGDFPVMNEVYADAFAGHRPARSTIAVAALPLAARVEVEVWAYVPR
jgi:2-iminobutanoate/2-iminopropanoate deaminase